jgi:prevent-host-death family protein
MEGMIWNVAEAKQRLSELLRKAAREPQTILNRSRPVAVVVDPETFEEFRAWRQARNARSVADAFAELRALGGAASAITALPKRKDRRNAFAETLG